MYNRSDWALMLVPKHTRDRIRQIANREKKKLWQVLEEAVDTHVRR